MRPSSMATSPRNGGLPVPSATQPPRIRTSGAIGALSLLGKAAHAGTEPRVEDVAEAVAEEVEAEDDEHDRGAREHREPPREVDVGAGGVQHPAPRRLG